MSGLHARYRWSTAFAWGLTLSGALMGFFGVIAIFRPAVNLEWPLILAFAAMITFAIGLVNCAASAALHAIKHRKDDGSQVDWTVFVPSLACAIGFAIAASVGVHIGWDILKANATDAAHLPSAGTMNLIFYILAFSKPAMSWIIEGRRKMDAEEVTNEEARRLKVEARRAAIAAAERAASGSAGPAPAPPPSSRIEPGGADSGNVTMLADARRVRELGEGGTLTEADIVAAVHRLRKKRIRPSFRNVARELGVTRSRVATVWGTGRPLVEAA